ncbi:MAG: dihydrolipoyllysine-residue acetyltransferase [Hyphomicrobiales bacterium]|nr:dihydrolipoyllysine-residue acetyltransferase [Hyphomicrobiales bacterium]
MAKVDVKVPDIGDFQDVPVIEVLVKPGDVVKVDQSLITLESDKATMDVPSPVAGQVAEVVAKVGDKVAMGTLIARVESVEGETAQAGAASPKAAPPPAPAAKGPGVAKDAAPPAKAPSAKAHAPASAKTAPINVTIPDIGDFTDVPVIEILVKAGDTVEAEQPIVTLESDKATMDVPSPAAGQITEILVKVGDKVSMGALIAKLDAGAAAAPIAPAQEDEADAKDEEDAAEAPETSPVAPRDLPPRPAPANPALTDFAGVFAGPAVRRLARELGLDLNQIKGTGEKGRITREDVKAAIAGEGGSGAAGAGAAAFPAVPTVDFAKFGPIETVPLSRIKRISGPRLHASWVNVPHVTHCDEADITDLDAFRKSLDEDAKKDKAKPYRVSLLPLLMRASVAALKAFPTFNAALNPTGDSLILRRYWHIGVAVDTPEGLVVAVVKDVDQKGVIDLARELGALSEKARAGKLAPAEMQGASFTISSLGGIGGTAFTPIVNAPEVAILGVVRSKMAPIWDGSAFEPRLMLPLCLSYDHRVIDGAAAARFMRHLASLLEDMRRIIL